jgi:hypothetical protein
VALDSVCQKDSAKVVPVSATRCDSLALNYNGILLVPEWCQSCNIYGTSAAVVPEKFTFMKYFTCRVPTEPQ